MWAAKGGPLDLAHSWGGGQARVGGVGQGGPPTRATQAPQFKPTPPCPKHLFNPSTSMRRVPIKQPACSVGAHLKLALGHLVQKLAQRPGVPSNHSVLLSSARFNLDRCLKQPVGPRSSCASVAFPDGPKPLWRGSS